MSETQHTQTRHTEARHTETETQHTETRPPAPAVVENMLLMRREDFDELLERAAERGARHALAEVGLEGPDAAHDIRELRSLLDAFNEAKKTAGLTIVKMLVTALVMALMAGAFVKLKVFGGAQ